MKKILIFTFLVINCILINAQNRIISIEDYYSFINSDSAPEDDDFSDIYFKDINNIREPFLGNWEGSYNNRTYIIQISNYIQPAPENNSLAQRDTMLMRYRVVENGKVIKDVFNLQDGDPLIPVFNTFISPRNYSFYYASEEILCGRSGSIYFHLRGSDSLRISLRPSSQFIDLNDCPNGPVSQIFPVKGSVTLTRVD